MKMKRYLCARSVDNEFKFVVITPQKIKVNIFILLLP